MTPPAPDGAARLVERAGLGRLEALTPLAGGANNRVLRADTAGGPAVLKLYFHHPADPRDRMGAEYAFLTAAWDGGVRCVPRPLAADPARHMALYGFVPGTRPAAATAALVDQAAGFIAALQSLRSAAGHLPPGSEACFTIAAHRATVERRLARLAALSPGTDLHAAASRLVRDEALPRFHAITTPADGDEPLPPERRCLSPSDFGFHNALVDGNGRAVFVDFEYAGWDDPAKLVGDFFHQPAVPVTMDHYPAVRDRIAALFPAPAATARRCDAVMPLYALKWVAILLNDFLPTGGSRRAFSAGHETEAQTEARLHRQLDKAHGALARLATLPAFPA